MVFHGSGNKNNTVGVSLDDQSPIRLLVLSTKEYIFDKGYGEKFYFQATFVYIYTKIVPFSYQQT